MPMANRPRPIMVERFSAEYAAAITAGEFISMFGERRVTYRATKGIRSYRKSPFRAATITSFTNPPGTQFAIWRGVELANPERGPILYPAVAFVCNPFRGHVQDHLRK